MAWLTDSKPDQSEERMGEKKKCQQYQQRPHGAAGSSARPSSLCVNHLPPACLQDQITAVRESWPDKCAKDQPVDVHMALNEVFLFVFFAYYGNIFFATDHMTANKHGHLNYFDI